MTRSATLSAAILAGGLLMSGPVLAQQPQPAKTDCGPQTIQGQITKIDPNGGKVTVKASDGKTHEFQASKETLQEYKVGDTLEARLRKC